MPLYTKLLDDACEFDVIIAGGGTAGCIVASRLADASPELSILVVESGPNNRDDPDIVHPPFFHNNLKPCSHKLAFYKGNKAPQLAGREPIVSTGGLLGGGSSVNAMMYTRAQRCDFESWDTPGWSADDMWPFLKKLETYHGPGASQHHGYDGPVMVSDGTYRCKKSEDDILSAAEKVGYPELTDLQDLDTNNGFSRWLRYVSPDGKRQDTAHTYLHPKLEGGKHPNLHVLVESQVLRVLFDKTTAVGIEYRPNPDFQAAMPLTLTPARTVKARRMVIVSCGAIATPLLLERSGVGDARILQRVGVPVVADLPGVGHDYQDHHLVYYPYKTDLEPDETLDGILAGREDQQALIDSNAKMIGWNGTDIGSKLRPTEAEVTALGPAFREAWDRDFKSVPNKPLMFIAAFSYYFGDASAVPPGQYMSMLNYSAYPYSRGHVHITGPSITDPIDFDVGFFSDKGDIDLKKHVWAYKKQREIMRRTRMYQGEVAAGHPPFASGSGAACVEEGGGAVGHDVEGDIRYSAEDDAAIEAWLRENVGTTWHSLGTAKMAPVARLGVVDEALGVHGLRGLKLADLSIVPENVGANTANTAMVIGEKAADMFVRELGLARA
ncbi:alcohol oxidase-like protein [Diaporthe sp. PMI_573]|nr:alcohol oxidase-like protein [Diaporthaceae sp. PMI_573]